MRAHASASFCMPGALRMRTPPPRPRRDTRLALLSFECNILESRGFAEKPWHPTRAKEFVKGASRAVGPPCLGQSPPRRSKVLLPRAFPQIQLPLRSLEWEGRRQGVLPGMASGPSDLIPKRQVPRNMPPPLPVTPPSFLYTPPTPCPILRR